MNLQNLNLRSRLLLGFAFVLAITTTMFLLNYQMQKKRDKTSQWVNHTNEVKSKSDKVMMHLIDMETGFRGYLISGNESFLEPYNSGVVGYQALLNELQNL